MPGTEGRGDLGVIVHWVESFSFAGYKVFWRWMVGMVAKQHDHGKYH